MSTASESWLDRHPWWGRLAFLGFGIFLSLFIRSGFLANPEIKQQADSEIVRILKTYQGTHSKSEELNQSTRP